MDEDVYTDDYETRSQSVVDAIEAVESAVAKVEAAVKEKWSSAVIVGWMILGAFLWDVPGNMWHSKWRCAATYSISSDNVVVEKHPHDCAFLAAPLGEKYCHYDREVSTLRRGTSTTGNRLVSYDEGKTWSVVESDPAVTNWPQYNTVAVVYINWKKVEE
jgi:hypothetical protein